jgi:hypothetical protein
MSIAPCLETLQRGPDFRRGHAAVIAQQLQQPFLLGASHQLFRRLDVERLHPQPCRGGFSQYQIDITLWPVISRLFAESATFTVWD